MDGNGISYTSCKWTFTYVYFKWWNEKLNRWTDSVILIFFFHSLKKMKKNKEQLKEIEVKHYKRSHWGGFNTLHSSDKSGVDLCRSYTNQKYQFEVNGNVFCKYNYTLWFFLSYVRGRVFFLFLFLRKSIFQLNLN